jgi:hypothetical protein
MYGTGSGMEKLEKLLLKLPDDSNEAIYVLFNRVETGLSIHNLEQLTEACGVLSAFYEAARVKIPDPLKVGNDLAAVLGKERSVDTVVEQSHARWRLQFEAYRLDALARRELAMKAKAREVIKFNLDNAVGYAALTPEEKKDCHKHLSKIRDIIEASDLDDRKKNNLFDHISQLSREIDKNGTRTDRFFAFASDFAFVMGDFARKAEPLTKELKSILRIVTKARARKEQTKLPAGDEVMQLPSSQFAKEGQQ